MRKDQLDHIVLRRTTDGDAGRLGRLAQLDGAEAPDSPGLVAEVRGRLVAYVSLADGEAIADPFEHTREILAILRLRAAQMQPSGAPEPHRGRIGRRLAARRRGTPSIGADAEGSALG